MGRSCAVRLRSAAAHRPPDPSKRFPEQRPRRPPRFPPRQVRSLSCQMPPVRPERWSPWAARDATPACASSGTPPGPALLPAQRPSFGPGNPGPLPRRPAGKPVQKRVHLEGAGGTAELLEPSLSGPFPRRAGGPAVLQAAARGRELVLAGGPHPVLPGAARLPAGSPEGLQPPGSGSAPPALEYVRTPPPILGKGGELPPYPRSLSETEGVAVNFVPRFVEAFLAPWPATTSSVLGSLVAVGGRSHLHYVGQRKRDPCSHFAVL